MERAAALFLACVFSCEMSFAQSAPVRSHSISSDYRNVWILGDHGRLSAYDGNDFQLLQKSASPLPVEVCGHPERIVISHEGLVLYANNGEGHLNWTLWRAGHLYKLLGDTTITRPGKGNTSHVINATRYPLPAADSRRLFWFENRLSVLQQGSGIQLLQSGEFRAWVSGLDNRNLGKTADFLLASCKCDTGVCEETCPRVDVWAPDEGITDFFFLTHWVPGQTTSDFVETDLYRATDGVWKKSRLDAPVEDFLDASDHGNSYIARTFDTACCGWDNESDDVTYVVHDGQRVTLFDEFGQFENKDYDISFFTPRALFSPDSVNIAYEISATPYAPDAKIRLAAGGKNNPDELRHIRHSLTGLPQVEIVRLADVAKRSFSLPNAELVGWLDRERLLIWQHGELLIINTTNWQLEATGLKTNRADRVFIR
ncbi:MAG: hypothetical protein ACYDDO_14245 [Acidiferrobacterales bacterium]